MAGFPEKILIVDDDPLLLELEESALSRVGDINIGTCNSCDKALSLIESFVPHLILLDLRMPKKNGTEMIMELRASSHSSDVPIIFVTGEHKVTMQDKYKELGVIGVIHKPFKSSDFIMNIQKMWLSHTFSSNNE